MQLPHSLSAGSAAGLQWHRARSVPRPLLPAPDREQSGGGEGSQVAGLLGGLQCEWGICHLHARLNCWIIFRRFALHLLSRCAFPPGTMPSLGPCAALGCGWPVLPGEEPRGQEEGAGTGDRAGGCGCSCEGQVQDEQGEGGCGDGHFNHKPTAWHCMDCCALIPLVASCLHAISDLLQSKTLLQRL